MSAFDKKAVLDECRWNENLVTIRIVGRTPSGRWAAPSRGMVYAYALTPDEAAEIAEMWNEARPDRWGHEEAVDD